MGKGGGGGGLALLQHLNGLGSMYFMAPKYHVALCSIKEIPPLN